MICNKTKFCREKSRVIIIGSSGFIGRALCAKASESGMAVIQISSSDINLTDEDSIPKLSSLFKPSDVVVMLASIAPDKSSNFHAFKKNLIMANNLRMAITATPVHHLLYLSSDAVYSRNFERITGSTPPSPDDLYGIMHWTREKILSELSSRINYTALRATMVVGKGDTHNAYGPNLFVRQAIGSSKIILRGNGQDTKDFISINNLVSVILLCINKVVLGSYNIASGQSHSFKEIAEAIALNFNSQIEINFIPRTQCLTKRSFDLSNNPRDFKPFQFFNLQKTIHEMLNQQS